MNIAEGYITELIQGKRKITLSLAYHLAFLMLVLIYEWICNSTNLENCCDYEEEKINKIKETLLITVA